MSHLYWGFEHLFQLFEGVTCHLGRTLGRFSTVPWTQSNPRDDGTPAATPTTIVLPFPYNTFLNRPSVYPYGHTYPGYGWPSSRTIAFGKLTQPPETTAITFAEPLPADKMLRLL